MKKKNSRRCCGRNVNWQGGYYIGPCRRPFGHTGRHLARPTKADKTSLYVPPAKTRGRG